MYHSLIIAKARNEGAHSDVRDYLSNRARNSAADEVWTIKSIIISQSEALGEELKVNFN